jgi:16S rRNA (guanine527-N7)-methyltransferase
MPDELITVKQKALLQEGIQALKLDSSVLEPLTIYVSELQKWNNVYNLSGFKSVEEHIVRNVFDCLAVASFVKGRRLMDLGTGAGLPGMLLALLRPDQEWVLLDGNGKKTRFLNQIKHQLALKNVSVVHSRAEQYQVETTFDGICSRAFDKIPDSLSLCQHLFDSKACFYALKGKVLSEDIEHLPNWASVKKVHEIKVPGLSEERHLIVINLNNKPWLEK